MAGAAQGIAKAVLAYQQAARGVTPPEPQPGGGSEFSQLVRSAVEGVINKGKESEQLSVAAIQDRADINEVVTAVSEAEVTLQTAVAIRDKVIEAYKDVIKMPI